jgi:hypothetical protein
MSLTTVQGGMSSALVAGTAVATTSGTSIDFTSIPSWVKRITVMFNGVSTNGSSAYQIQIGSGSFTTTGYLGYAGSYNNGNTTATLSSSTGLLFTPGNGAATLHYGTITIQNISGNNWVSSCCGAGLDGGGGVVSRSGGGSISIGGTLDRIRITTINGTDTFDAGSINILYE